MKRLLTITLLLLPLASEAPSREQQQQARRRITASKKAPTPAEAEALKIASRKELIAQRALHREKQAQQTKQLPIKAAPKVVIHNLEESESSDSDFDSDTEFMDANTPKGATKKAQTLMKKLTKAACPATPILHTTVVEEQALGTMTTYHRRKSGLPLALRAVKEGHLPYFVKTNGTKWLSWYNQGAKAAVDEVTSRSKSTTQELIETMAENQRNNLSAQQDVMTLFVNGEAASKSSTEFEITEGRAKHAAQAAAQAGKDATSVLVAALQYAHRATTTQRQLVEAAKASHPHPETLDEFFPQHNNLEELMDHAQDQFEESELARRAARAKAIAAKEKAKKEATSELKKLAAIAKEKETAAATTTTEDAK